MKRYLRNAISTSIPAALLAAGVSNDIIPAPFAIGIGTAIGLLFGLMYGTWDCLADTNKGRRS